MPKMTDQDLVALVGAEFNDAKGAPSGEITEERADAWDFYLKKPLGNEQEGQSQVVTSDVADVIDGMMPSLLRIFTTADNLVEFKAVGPEDVPAAEQESDYVNHVFFTQNDAFMIMYTWFFDSLVQKNGIVKAWWDDSEQITTETYSGLTEEELTELLTDDEVEVTEREERDGETVQNVEVPLPDGSISTEAIVLETKVNDVTIRRTGKRNQVTVENVAPEEYRISSDAKDLNPNKARMVGHEREMTRSELLGMGFDEDVINELPPQENTQNTLEEISRQDKTDDNDNVDVDKSQDRILVKEAYIKVDFDGDGKSELRQVFTANQKLLSNEEIDRQPFHVICPYPLPHKHFGLSASDKVMDVQTINSTLIRQTLDNLYHSNNPSHGVWEQGIGDNTLDDLLTSRVASVKRFKRPPSESYMPITVPFTANQSFSMIEYMDKVKGDRTGVSADSQGLTPEALKNIQQSVLTAATDMSRMKIEAVVRVFAETGLKSLFRHIHELLLKYQDKPEIVELRNRWVEVNPSEWRERKNMKVKIGLGIGTREQNLLHLNSIWDIQSQMAQGGGLGLTVTPKNLFNTAAEMVKNANLKAPEMFFKDPGEGMPQQQDDGAAQLAEQSLQLQGREQELDRERNAAQHEREMLKIAQQQEKMNNDFQVAMENIATKLTELELTFSTNVPGAKV